MFVVSLLSILMALIATAIAKQLSPIPDYPYALPEYMWIDHAEHRFIYLAYHTDKNILYVLDFTK